MVLHEISLKGSGPAIFGLFLNGYMVQTSLAGKKWRYLIEQKGLTFRLLTIKWPSIGFGFAIELFVGYWIAHPSSTRMSLIKSSYSNQKQWVLFAGWTAISLALFSRSLFALFRLSWHDDTYSHILLVPAISAWLLFLEFRGREISSRPALWPGIAFMAPAALSVFLGIGCSSCTPKDCLALYVSALVLTIVAGFSISFGIQKAWDSSFALSMLIFAIPIPDVILGKVIYWLQSGSASIAEILFDISGAPVLRDGFVFRFPKISIEVAQECSGIRSSLALLILALLVAHFSFKPFWKKSVFVFAGLCMMLVKNGVRIASLTLLANYVNPDFLYGNLHHRGGIVFFLLGLALLFPVFWLLRKGEARESLVPVAD